MIIHQKSLLREFLNENRNMKLNIRTEAIFAKPEHLDDGDWDEFEESEILYKLPSTRCNIHNEDDLTQAIEDSVKQISLQIEKLEATKSNSQQQNALGYNLSMQGIGTVAIDGPRFEEFLRSRKVFLRSRKGVSQGFCCWVAQLG